MPVQDEDLANPLAVYRSRISWIMEVSVSGLRDTVKEKSR
jgi:hypothetical protein